MGATAALFAVSDASAKQLGAALPVLVLVAFRYAFQALTLAGWILARRGVQGFRTKAPGLQLLRAALLLGNGTTAFLGVQAVPLSEFTALMLLAPVISTVLSIFLLRARITAAAWCCVALAGVGMLMVVRPGTEGLGAAALLPLASAACLAGVQVINRLLATSEHIAVTNFLSAGGVLAMLVTSALVHPLPQADALRALGAGGWLLLLTLGAAATLGHMAMTAAFRAAPVSSVAPLAYMQIAFAALIGWIAFGAAPDRVALVGMVLIAIGGAGNVLVHAARGPKVPAGPDATAPRNDAQEGPLRDGPPPLAARAASYTHPMNPGCAASSPDLRSATGRTRRSPARLED